MQLVAHRRAMPSPCLCNAGDRLGQVTHHMTDVVAPCITQSNVCTQAVLLAGAEGGWLYCRVLHLHAQPDTLGLQAHPAVCSPACWPSGAASTAGSNWFPAPPSGCTTAQSLAGVRAWALHDHFGVPPADVQMSHIVCPLDSDVQDRVPAPLKRSSLGTASSFT